ncbi:MAG TPA: hypothetical protein VL651_06420 [Bacteroidia bacterium]|jgi:hypothetical protein|nr:hypothetical protein [Bacteroidia bacterium]
MFTPDELGIHIIYILLWTSVVLWVVITPLWILQMQKALETIAPPFRTMESGMTWLAMIPLFGMFWQFMVSTAVANSFNNEFTARGIIIRESRPGSSLGMTANIFFCTFIIPVYGILFGLISYIPRLMHLFRIKSYTDHLQHLSESQASQMTQPVEVFDWEQYRQSAEEATRQIQNIDPDRFKPKDTMDKNEENDLDRWRKK